MGKIPLKFHTKWYVIHPLDLQLCWEKILKLLDFKDPIWNSPMDNLKWHDSRQLPT